MDELPPDNVRNLARLIKKRTRSELLDFAEHDPRFTKLSQSGSPTHVYRFQDRSYRPVYLKISRKPGDMRTRKGKAWGHQSVRQNISRVKNAEKIKAHIAEKYPNNQRVHAPEKYLVPYQASAINNYRPEELTDEHLALIADQIDTEALYEDGAAMSEDRKREIAQQKLNLVIRLQELLETAPLTEEEKQRIIAQYMPREGVAYQTKYFNTVKNKLAKDHEGFSQLIDIILALNLEDPHLANISWNKDGFLFYDTDNQSERKLEELRKQWLGNVRAWRTSKLKGEKGLQILREHLENAKLPIPTELDRKLQKRKLLNFQLDPQVIALEILAGAGLYGGYSFLSNQKVKKRTSRIEQDLLRTLYLAHQTEVIYTDEQLHGLAHQAVNKHERDLNPEALSEITKNLYLFARDYQNFYITQDPEALAQTKKYRENIKNILREEYYISTHLTHIWNKFTGIFHKAR